MKVGFVGLGNMGAPMAQNLVATGHDVQIFDLVKAAMDSVEGAHQMPSAATAAQNVDVFISMLPAGLYIVRASDESAAARKLIVR